MNKNNKTDIDILIPPSHPSTYQYTDEEWKKICKKDGFTAAEIMESARRNGVGRIWSFYVTGIRSKNESKRKQV